MTLKEKLEDAGYENVLVMDEFDSAFIGMSHDDRAIYDYDKIVDSVMVNDGADYDDAVEYVDYNVIQSLPADGSGPVVLYKLDLEG